MVPPTLGSAVYLFDKPLVLPMATLDKADLNIERLRWNGRADFLGGFNPGVDRVSNVQERFFLGLALAHAPGQARNFNDPHLVLGIEM